MYQKITPHRKRGIKTWVFACVRGCMCVPLCMQKCACVLVCVRACVRLPLPKVWAFAYFCVHFCKESSCLSTELRCLYMCVYVCTCVLILVSQIERIRSAKQEEGNVNAQWYIEYAVTTSHWLLYKPSNHQLLSYQVCLQQGLKILHNYNVSYCSSFRTNIAFYTCVLQKLASWHCRYRECFPWVCLLYTRY